MKRKIGRSMSLMVLSFEYLNCPVSNDSVNISCEEDIKMHCLIWEKLNCDGID